MKSVALVRLTEQGRRAFPASFEEAEKLVREGKAVKHNRGLYEMCSVQPASIEEQEDTDQEEPEPRTDNTYDTKVMEPAKRRGRLPNKYPAANKLKP